TFSTVELHAQLKNSDNGVRLRQLLSYGDSNTVFELQDSGRLSQNAFDYINDVVPRAQEIAVGGHPDDARARDAAAPVDVRLVVPPVLDKKVRVPHWSQSRWFRGLDEHTEHMDPNGKQTTIGRRL